MKCPNCKSTMLVTDETSTSRSMVTFYRCSLCVGEHVTSQPLAVPDQHQQHNRKFQQTAIQMQSG